MLLDQTCFMSKNQEQNLMVALDSNDWSDILLCADVNKNCDPFHNSNKALWHHKAFLACKKNKSSQPWINSQCKKLMVHRVTKKSLKSGLIIDS